MENTSNLTIPKVFIIPAENLHLVLELQKGAISADLTYYISSAPKGFLFEVIANKHQVIKLVKEAKNSMMKFLEESKDLDKEDFEMVLNKWYYEKKERKSFPPLIMDVDTSKKSE